MQDHMKSVLDYFEIEYDNSDLNLVNLSQGIADSRLSLQFS